MLAAAPWPPVGILVRYRPYTRTALQLPTLISQFKYIYIHYTVKHSIVYAIEETLLSNLKFDQDVPNGVLEERTCQPCLPRHL
jgi:hypothetical protein